MNRVKAIKKNAALAKEPAVPPKDINELLRRMTPEFQYEKPWWKVARTYFNEHLFTEHQIDSYNTFMREKLPNILTNYELEYTKNSKKYLVNFDNVYVKKPEFTESNFIVKSLYPADCRTRDLTYTNKLYVDVNRYHLDTTGKVLDSRVFQNVYIGAIPCMVKSSYCSLSGLQAQELIKMEECARDPGGYFIINGIEKVLMSLDRMGHNEIFVFKSKDKDTIKLPQIGSDKNRSIPCDWSAEVRSFTEIHEPNITTTYIRMSAQQLDKGEDARMYVEIQNLKSPVPWPVVFMALDVSDPVEMCSYVCSADDEEIMRLLQPSLNCPHISSQEAAIKYLADYVINAQADMRETQIKRILRDKLFQNISDLYLKRYYLGHMTYQLLSTAIGRRNEDDRDHYGRKRVETAGSLINNLFKSIWKRILHETKNHLEKKRTDDIAQILYGKITNYIKPPFATGNWTATKVAKSSRTGISQLLNRHNFISTLSNIRRVITPNDKNSRIIRPRHLHGSQWMYMCPAETPEGQTTGLIKNLSMLTTVTLGTDDEPIMDWLRLNTDIIELISLDSNRTLLQKKVKIFVNGTWVGVTTDPVLLVEKLRGLRRVGKISREVSISILKDTVRILTDEGRVIAPFLIVTNGKLQPLPDGEYTWSDLVIKNIVEYLDPNELETLYHSEFPWKLDADHTHSVIHPSLMLGVAASTAPFPDHNQSPRNIYQCLWEEEYVLMANGQRKRIKDVRVNDLVITYNPEVMITEYTRVTATMNDTTLKDIVQVITLSARKITVTSDHLMLTDAGWKAAGTLTSTDKVAISMEPAYADAYTSTGILFNNTSLPNEYKRFSPAVPNFYILCRMLGYAIGQLPIGLSNSDLHLSFVDTGSYSKWINDMDLFNCKNYIQINDNTFSWDNYVTVLLTEMYAKLREILQVSELATREVLGGFFGGSRSNTNRFYIKKIAPHFALFSEALSAHNITHVFTDSIFSINYNDIATRYGFRYNSVRESLVCRNVEMTRFRNKIGTITVCGDYMYVPVYSVLPMKNVRIADITVESDNHCFVGGDNFCVHNSAMCKQALGIYAGNFMHRYETSAHILCYPQKPIVNTKTMQLLGMESLPTGQNLIVAIMCGAYNQEDSVLINKRAIDNGALRSVCYTGYSESNYRKGANLEEVKKPEKTCVQEARLKGYENLDDDGIPRENVPMCKRDIIIGKINTTNVAKDASIVIKPNGLEENAVLQVFADDPDYPDRKVYMVNNGCAIVDRSIRTLNEDSFSTVKVRTRQVRVPQIGDKVASRSAQKGIIGMIVPPQNMPFSKTTGMIPELIINPNAIPSRMTIAQILESVLGKVCALNGLYGDCSPFEPDFSLSTIEEQLKARGFEQYGNEVMIDGKTGEEMPCTLFMGPTYYQRLKHMVDDKIHSRDQDGPRETLTRQPIEGRKRNGGFRIGEMETWCGISHGASAFLIDRLVNNSDGYEMYVCDHCGNVAIATLITRRFECKHCSQNTAISKIRIPYAFKLLMQELQATGMGIWFKVDTTEKLLIGNTQSH